VRTTGILAGAPYAFRLRAQNALGWGAAGPSTTVVPSSAPVAMTAVTTAPASVYAQISWTAPDARGASITAYRVLIRAGDGSVREELAYCNGADATVVANRNCLVPIDVLKAPPYSLTIGTLIAA